MREVDPENPIQVTPAPVHDGPVLRVSEADVPDREWTEYLGDNPFGAPPRDPPPPKPKHKLNGKKGAIGMPSDAPLASMAASQPAVPRWRVGVMVAGKCEWLGTVASASEPEELVRSFPAALPPVGQSADFLLQGVDQLRRETGDPVSFTVSGASPEVQAARAAFAQATTPVGVTSLVAGAAERVYADQIENLKREREALAARAAKLEEERVESIRASASAAQDQHQRAMLEARQAAELRLADETARSKRLLDEERERRRQEKEDRDAERAAERERLRDERAAERQERAEREATAERAAAAERDRQREHALEIARLQANASLESSLTRFGTVAGALGLDLKGIVSKVMGGGDAPSAAEGLAPVVGSVVEKLVGEIGEVVRRQMDLQQAMLDRDEGTVRQLPPPRPRMAPPAPRQLAQAPQKPKQPVVEETDDEPTAEPSTPTPTIDPALAAVPMPVQRKARIALRSLAGKLDSTPEAEWEQTVTLAVAASPAIISYTKALGLQKAATEAGFSIENITKLAALGSRLGLT